VAGLSGDHGPFEETMRLDLATSFSSGRRLVCLLALGFVFGPGAAAADPPELVALARAYEHGEGVAKDPVRAAELYCEAARVGDAEAAYALGWMYANGRGLPRDDAHAAALFERAADGGHEYARRMLVYLAGTPAEPPNCLRPVEPPAEASPLAEPEPEAFDNLPPWKQRVADLVVRMAPRYGIDPRLALAMIAVESNFDANARSQKDARGLMQLIPKTAARYNVKDPFNQQQNLRGGLAYLRFLIAYYRGQVSLATAAYNAGEAAVDRYRGVPPFPETQAYVRRVLALYHREHHPYDASQAEPSPIIEMTRASNDVRGEPR
jgi:hypothetical protein